MTKIDVAITGFAAGDRIMKSIPAQLSKELKTGLRKAGNHVVKRAKQLVPPPGYPGDKPDLKPLRDTLGVEVKEGRTNYAVVGPKRPAGAHGHLVEEAHHHFSHGKATGVQTQPHPFMDPAARQTKPAQDRELADAIRKMHRIVTSG